MIEYKFESIYRFTDIIYQSVKINIEFFNFNLNEFIKSSTTFQKKSLLHIYIECTLYNYFNRNFFKNGDCIEEDEIEEWKDLFETYNIDLDNPDYNQDGYEDFDWAYNWFKHNENCFKELFQIMSFEIVHILFANKKFLLNFIKLARQSFNEIPKELLTKKGIIKRILIPKWVKRAVFYRDYGHCVFCNKDLTGVFSTLTSANYDHMVPLNKNGFNDICNIQLTCEKCNKSKGAKEDNPIYKFEPRW